MDSKVVLSDKNPHDKSNIFSKLFLTWSFSMFRRGYRQGITLGDLFQARKGDESGRLGDRLEQAWEIELENERNYGTKPSFMKAIVRSFWVEYMLVGLLVAFLFVIIWPMIPFTLALFIQYFSEDKSPEAYRNAHIYCFLMNTCSVLSSLLLTHTQLDQGRIGMRVRVAACSLMYRKILKLNAAGLSKTEPGHVINLMSNDVCRFDLVSVFLNYVWTMPIVVPVVSFFIWQHIGAATVAALVVIFFQTAFVQVYLSNIQGKYRGKIAKRTDERVKVMGGLVNGIQVIKMYTWEKPFQKLVDRLRKLEISFVMKTSMVKGVTAALSVFSERFILFSAIVTFVLLGGHIRAQTTFALVQYFNLMQLACNILFPFGLAFLAEAMVSVKRIEEFLLLDEKEPKTTRPKAIDPNSLLADVDDKETGQQLNPTGLSILNVVASWQDNALYTLDNISMTVSPGQFIGIAGPVGSGKSSLLQLILGELKPKQGKITLGGSIISYASQEPWLFVATVRENILFGLPFDRVRYKRVVKACALIRDFELLPHGDSTLVGERGVSLSGGQRARISLARACYRRADIYLLDDPLSAVDTHVGKHLVSECVQGLLHNATRILVTHQLHHLKEADQVYILRHRQIEAHGTFDEISNTPLFAELSQKEEEDEEPVDDKPDSVQSKTAGRIQPEENVQKSSEDQAEVEEMTASGNVPMPVYSKYFTAGNSWSLLSFVVFSVIIAQVVTSASDLWLTHWMNDVEAQYIDADKNATSLPRSNNTDYPQNETELTTDTPLSTTVASLAANVTSHVTAEQDTINNLFYIYIWAVAIIGCIVFNTGKSIVYFWACMRSSISLHNQMFVNIMGATMRFFDTNPSGRILNRFSKDMGMIDEVLPRLSLEAIQISMVMLGIIVMVAIVNPLMLLTTLVCGVAMYFWTAMYLVTAQGIKRVEGVTRSPVFSHVTATMSGLATVRASDAQKMLLKQFDDKQDIHTAAWYLSLVANAAFVIWLSLICATYVIVVGYTFLFMDDGTTKSGNVGLAISQGLILVNMVQYGVKQGADVVAQMTSVERILQYTSLPQESKDGVSPPNNWPQQGRVDFKDLSLRYSEGAEPVLKELNVKIESGWKVGVVGRTGAGKSSLISALFRLAPIEGSIYIDDIDATKLKLEELRSKISIIPQEPVLFSASLRYNMDPFEKYTDADIWNALEQVEIKSSITSLSAPVAAGGLNFSAGERQLLCLARAALAHNKILVLDEATANVDPTTDAMIQKSIRKHFADCTVLTVAHRLHTVADSDRVIVIEAGQIIEFGHPHQLLKNDEGHFSSMVKELGQASEHSLRELAANAYKDHVAKKVLKSFISQKSNTVKENKE
ncbi:putative multidrug resistance-associated protein lethal(2)03659 [Anticarsia gemmatalis]|uniref:putative multidrug resistance-associated protein lethal(2)03659 n=1 Tax=Anticarsia gemmatalis TaxID=129554 RepID=UPI003F76F5CA